MTDDTPLGLALDPTLLSLLRPILVAIAAMPKREFLAFVRLFEEWQTWPRDRRAMLAKTLCPDLREKDIAVLAGISVRQLCRLEAYQAFKPRLADFKASRPRMTSTKRRRVVSQPSESFG